MEDVVVCFMNVAKQTFLNAFFSRVAHHLHLTVTLGPKSLQRPCSGSPRNWLIATGKVSVTVFLCFFFALKTAWQNYWSVFTADNRTTSILDLLSYLCCIYDNPHTDSTDMTFTQSLTLFYLIFKYYHRVAEFFSSILRVCVCFPSFAVPDAE